MNMNAKLSKETAIATAIDTMLRPDDKQLIGAAAARCAILVEFFKANAAEDIDAAISSEFLASNLIAMSPQKSETWTKETIAELSELERTPEVGKSESDAVAAIKSRAAGMRSAYIRFSHFRKLYKCASEYPAIWTEFQALDMDWNNRMSWVVSMMDEARNAQKLDAASAVLVAASEIVVDGKVVPQITDEQAREQVARLAAAQKTLKERAAQTPRAIADDCLKLIAKRKGDYKQVLAAMIEAVYGENYEVLSSEALAVLRAKVK
jgi:hypothetical protein